MLHCHYSIAVHLSQIGNELLVLVVYLVVLIITKVMILQSKQVMKLTIPEI